jgi:hypothetical protein
MNCPQCGALIHGNFSVKVEKKCPCGNFKLLLDTIKKIQSHLSADLENRPSLKMLKQAAMFIVKDSCLVIDVIEKETE